MRCALVGVVLMFGCGGEAERPTEPEAAEQPSAEAPAPEPAPSPTVAPSARAFFVEPTDGATVKSPVKVVFGVEGMSVAPAGEVTEGTGHHHLIVDGEPVAVGTVVPKDDKHIHYGQGQTETTLELSPGEHSLTLQFADGAHSSYGPGLSSTIRVKVE